MATALLVPILLLLMDLIDVSRFVPISRDYDWLSFLGGFGGGLFGGLATFVAMYWTLRSQRKSDDDKNRLSVMPILEYELRDDEKDFDNSQGQLAAKGIGGWQSFALKGASWDDGSSEHWYFNLIVSNVGLGHAQVASAKLAFRDNYQEIEAGQCIIYGDQRRFVKTGSQRSMRCTMLAPRDAFGLTVNPDGSSHSTPWMVEILVSYQDLLGDCYEQLIQAIMGLRTEGDGKVRAFIEMNRVENFRHLGRCADIR